MAAAAGAKSRCPFASPAMTRMKRFNQGKVGDPSYSTSTPPAALNVAVTALAAFMVTTQEPAPVQAPDQPAKVAPLVARAVRVTTVPLE